MSLAADSTLDFSRAQELRIRTPEGIVFSMPLAGPITRFAAWLVDTMAIVAIFVTSISAFSMIALISEDWGQALMIVFYFAVDLGYFIALEWLLRGQTLGKRLMRLRVVDEQGLRLQFGQVVMRNLLRMVDRLPAFYLIGGVACLLSRNAQRLGDFAAGTIVIRVPKIEQPALEQIMAGKFNSFRAYPHIEARLRANASPAEAGVALEALLRRDRLDPTARVELFARIAEHLREVVRFPAEATDGLSDEQYVRNAVDTLYRTRQG